MAKLSICSRQFSSHCPNPVLSFKIRNQQCCSGNAGDKAIFVYFYQVISFILTVRPDSVVAALLSYVSILFENHSNNSQNEWKWFVIGPLEKSSVTDTFSVSRMMMMIAGLWMSEVCRDHSGSVVISGDRRQEGETERLTGDRIQLSSDPARIKIGCWELGLSTGGWGGHQWLAAEEQRRRGAQNGG